MSISKRHFLDKFSETLIKLAGLLSVMILVGILFLLLTNGLSFFKFYQIKIFFKGNFWNPLESFSILPLLLGTVYTSLFAMVIAIPVSILSAAYIIEFAPKWIKTVSQPVIELLASVPSVIIGFWGITVVGPFICKIFKTHSGLNLLNGSILLASMILPTIISISQDAIYAVPQKLKEASYALGANKFQTLFFVTIPTASPGLIAACLLGFGRAIGETMIVLMVTGNVPMIPSRITDSIRTITSTIAIELGEVPYNTSHYFALFSIALFLFAISLSINMMVEYIVYQIRKYQ